MEWEIHAYSYSNSDVPLSNRMIYASLKIWVMHKYIYA